MVSHVFGISEFVLFGSLYCVGILGSSLILFDIFGRCLAIFPHIGIYGQLQLGELYVMIMSLRFVDDGGLASEYGRHRCVDGQCR